MSPRAKIARWFRLTPGLAATSRDESGFAEAISSGIEDPSGTSSGRAPIKKSIPSQQIKINLKKIRIH